MDNVRIARALSDPVRYKILMMLAHSKKGCCSFSGTLKQIGLCNCEIMTTLDMIQSRVSYHMKELIESGLVTEEPRGRWKYYSLNLVTFKQFIDQLNHDFYL